MLRSTISATLLALMFGAQSLAEPPPVSLAVEGPGSALARGDEGTLRLVLSIDAPWYIYAPTGLNADQGMVEASVEMRRSDQVQFRDATFPEAIPFGEFDVLMDERVEIIQPFRVRTGAAPGETVIQGRFEYQACKAEFCLPPERLGFKTKINVKAGVGSWIQRSNDEPMPEPDHLSVDAAFEALFEPILIGQNGLIEKNGSQSRFSDFLAEYDAAALHFRERGIEFWNTYPEDPRRYSWLILTNALQPAYAYDKAQWIAKSHYPVANDFDRNEADVSAWKDAYTNMRESFLASNKVTSQHRRLLSWLEVYNDLSSARDDRARGDAVDEEELVGRVVAYAAEYGNPLVEDTSHSASQRYLVVLVRMLVNRADIVRLDQKSLASFSARLKAIEAETYEHPSGVVYEGGYARWVGEEIEDGSFVQFVSDDIRESIEQQASVLQGDTASRIDAIQSSDSIGSAIIYDAINFPNYLAPETWEGRAIFRLQRAMAGITLREQGLGLWDSMSSAQKTVWVRGYNFSNVVVRYPSNILEWLNQSAASPTSLDFEKSLYVLDEGIQKLRQFSKEFGDDRQASAAFSGVRVVSLAAWFPQFDGSAEEASELKRRFGDTLTDHFDSFGIRDSFARNAVASQMRTLIRHGHKIGYTDEEIESTLQPFILGLDDELEATAQGFLDRNPLEIGRSVRFEARTFGGEAVSTDDLRGQYILVDHWDTNCAPCIADFPEVNEIYNEFKDKGFEVFSIAYDGTSNRARVEQIKDRIGLAWQTVDGEGLWGAVTAKYGISGFPEYMLIDRDGRLLATTEDLRPPSRIREILERELAKEGSE